MSAGTQTPIERTLPTCLGKTLARLGAPELIRLTIGKSVITMRGKPVARVVPEKAARPGRRDRSGAIDRTSEFSKTCRTRRKVNLQKLIDEGRL